MNNGSEEKLMPLFWLHWLHAPSLVSIGQSNSDLTLITDTCVGSNPKLRLDVSYPYSKFGVNRPKQIKVIEQKLNFYF